MYQFPNKSDFKRTQIVIKNLMKKTMIIIQNLSTFLKTYPHNFNKNEQYIDYQQVSSNYLNYQFVDNCLIFWQL